MPTSTSALPGTIISNLPIAATVDGTEYYPMVQGGTTKRVTGALLTANPSTVGVSTASGTVSSGIAGQVAYYATTGSAVSGNTYLNISSGTVTVGLASSTTGYVALASSAGGTTTIVPSAGTTAAFNLPSSAAVAGQPLLYVSSASPQVYGILQVPAGGTGSSNFAAYQVITGGTASSAPFQSVTAGTSGFVLTYVSSTALPTWQAPASGTGTVTTGGAGQVAYYSSAGTSVTGSTYTIISSGTLTLGSTSASITGKLALASSAGTVSTWQPSSATVTLTAPVTSTTLIGKDTVDTLTGKTFDTAGSSNSFLLGGVAISTASSILNTLGSSRGQILFNNSSAVWGALTVGTSNQFLMGGAIPGYSSPRLPTTQSLTSGTSATYSITSTAATWIEVYMTGGGSGGGGVTNASSAVIAGSSGGQSLFNAVQALGASPSGSGAGAPSVIVGGLGGTGGSGTATRRSPGYPGAHGGIAAAGTFATPGFGGGSYFGGGAIPSTSFASGGNSAAANSGAGGSGAAGGATSFVEGGGGGGGEFVYLLINSPSSTYLYTIGAGGAGGAGATATGGAGGSGFIFVVEHYV